MRLWAACVRAVEAKAVGELRREGCFLRDGCSPSVSRDGAMRVGAGISVTRMRCLMNDVGKGKGEREICSSISCGTRMGGICSPG